MSNTLDDFFGDGGADNIPECSFCGDKEGELIVSVQDAYGPTHWHHAACEAADSAKKGTPITPTWDEAIDPRITEVDRKYLRMTPIERQQHLASQGHALPTERTDKEVIAWFESLGEIGLKRLELASAIQAPPGLGSEVLSYWHRRVVQLFGQPVTILTE